MIPQPDKFVRPGEVMSTIAPQQLGVSLVAARANCAPWRHRLDKSRTLKPLFNEQGEKEKERDEQCPTSIPYLVPD
jgi:hypothetical protein